MEGVAVRRVQIWNTWFLPLLLVPLFSAGIYFSLRRYLSGKFWALNECSILNKQFLCTGRAGVTDDVVALRGSIPQV